MSNAWKLPAPGDIVWCLFPEIPDIQPGPKPRPALVMRIERRTDGDVVGVVYATSKHLDRLETGEISITKSKHPAAYELAGLSYDTKFDFKVIVDLPWTDRYFKVPPHSPHGNTPKLGTLHPTMMRAFALAYQSAASR